MTTVYGRSFIGFTGCNKSRNRKSTTNQISKLSSRL